MLSAGIWIGEQWNQVNCHSWNPHHRHHWAIQTIKWKYEDSFLLINVLIASLVYNYKPKPGLSLSNWSHDRKGTLHYGISQRCCLPDFYIRYSFLTHFLRMKQAQYHHWLTDCKSDPITAPVYTCSHHPHANSHMHEWSERIFYLWPGIFLLPLCSADDDGIKPGDWLGLATTCFRCSRGPPSPSSSPWPWHPASPTHTPASSVASTLR